MKIFIAIILLSSQSFAACPNLTGKFICPEDDYTIDFLMQITEENDDGHYYKLTVGHYYSTIKINTDWVTYVSSCDSVNGLDTLVRNFKEGYTGKGDVEHMYINKSGHLQQDYFRAGKIESTTVCYRYARPETLTSY